VLNTSGLISYWRLGEASGTNALDSKGTNTGIYQSGVTLGAADALTNDPNTAASFNGTSSRVSLPALAVVTNFTIEGWTNLNSGATANENGNNALYANGGNVTILARPGTPNTIGYASVWLNGTQYMLQPNSTQSNLNTWVHWVLTRSGNTLTFYRNGVQIAQRTDLPATATANISGWIGSWGGGAYFLNGRIDEVAVYNTALTAAQVTSHYNAAISGPAPAGASSAAVSATSATSDTGTNQSGIWKFLSWLLGMN
jgi:hypothetical protein